ncbi:EKC/KEOPS complex subunit GON7 [Tachyglossus aculeatus]|uniref:EKC/KEOPS complex subunit GON7 n=1 Tax=Tachyglossus aculeatus TaxID=9261 RepID=UPI0018F4F90E|nr:EKC/KEOPS complex subunit GON7 [Tachyglossus aculeatus]
MAATATAAELVGRLVGRDGRRREVRVSCGPAAGAAPVGLAAVRAGLPRLKERVAALLADLIMAAAAPGDPPGPHGDGEEEEEEEEEEDQDEENNTEIKTYSDGPAAKRGPPTDAFLHSEQESTEASLLNAKQEIPCQKPGAQVALPSFPKLLKGDISPEFCSPFTW